MKLLKPVLLAIAGIILFSDANARAENKIQQCVGRGEMFRISAMMRDNGRSPQDIFPYVAAYVSDGEFPTTTAYAKAVVNAVYFNPDFANAGGSRLANQVRDDCMRDGKPQFQPLK